MINGTESCSTPGASKRPLQSQGRTTGPIPFRKAYIKSVVDRIEGDDRAIRIIGDQATLEQVITGDQNADPNVRSFVRAWRATVDEDGHYSSAVPL